MSNKLEEILTNPENTENFKDKFLGLILDFLEENNYDLNNLDQECKELICKIYDKNMLSSVSGGVNNKLNLAKKAGALGLSALCAVSPAFGIENQSDLKDQSTDVRKEQKIANAENQTKKKTWLNKVDKSTLLNIFGWGKFALTGTEWLYEKVKSKNQRDSLAITYSAKTHKLESQLEVTKRKLNQYTNLPKLADSFEKDLTDLTNVVSKQTPEMNRNYCFARCYLFLLGLCIMKHTANKTEILAALTSCGNALTLYHAGAFTEKELLLGKTNYEKYIQNAKYTHLSQLLYLVFGDTFDGKDASLRAVSNTIANGKVGLRKFEVELSNSELGYSCRTYLGNINNEIYLEYCNVAKTKKTNFKGKNLNFIDSDGLQ